jgi:integrase
MRKKISDSEKVKALTDEGKTLDEMARSLGVHVSTVKRRRKELGIHAEEGSRVEDWIEGHVKVKAWLAKLKDRRGRLQYGGLLRRYCEWRGKSPEELLEEAWADTQYRKPHEKLLPDLLLLYKQELEDRGKAPTTIAFNLTGVRSFYEKNGYSIIKRKDLITNPQPRDENGKAVINPEQMRELNSIMTPLDRALYLTMYQSGLSAAEALNLKIRDVKRIEDGIIRLPLRARAKTGVKFWTFVGNDAREAIEAWLVKRNSGNLVPGNLEVSAAAVVKRDEDLLFITYDSRRKKWGRVSMSTLDRRMREYCRQLGWLEIRDGELGKKGLQNRWRPHALRMSFSTILKNKNVPGLHVEHMLGHAPAYNGAYDVVNENDLFESYKRAEKYLSIKPEASKELQTIEALRQDLELKAGTIAELRDRMAKLEEEREELRARENERAPYDEIMSKLVNDPDVLTVLSRKLKGLDMKLS